MTQPPQQPDPQGSPDQTTTQLPAPYATAPSRSRARVITAVVIAAVLVVGGAVAIYLATRSDPADNAAPNPAGTSTSSGPAPTAPSASASVPAPPGVDPSSAGPDPSGPPPEPTGQAAAVDPGVQETAQRYAKAVTDRDEATAKSLNCNNQEPGILFDDGITVEVIGKTQMLDANSATIDVKVTIGQAEPLEGFPLLLNKEPRGWCVS